MEESFMEWDFLYMVFISALRIFRESLGIQLQRYPASITQEIAKQVIRNKNQVGAQRRSCGYIHSALPYQENVSTSKGQCPFFHEKLHYTGPEKVAHHCLLLLQWNQDHFPALTTSYNSSSKDTAHIWRTETQGGAHTQTTPSFGWLVFRDRVSL